MPKLPFELEADKQFISDFGTPYKNHPQGDLTAIGGLEALPKYKSGIGTVKKLELKEKIELFNVDNVTHARTEHSHGEIFWDTLETSFRYNPNQGWRRKVDTVTATRWLRCECPELETEYQNYVKTCISESARNLQVQEA